MADELEGSLSKLGRDHIAGEVHTRGSRLATRCATDMSMFRASPIAVVRPRDEDDIRAVLDFAVEQGVAVTARAGGSNTGGAALSEGIVLLFDDEETWGTLHYDSETREVTAGPAARHDRLQALLGKHGRMLPSDPSSGPLSRIGGNVATKASGPHALKHGAIDRYLAAARLLCSDGSVMDTEEGQARIAEGISSMQRRLLADEQSRAYLENRRERKIASGYNLFALLEPEPALARAKIMAGSVATLGIITAARLATEPLETGRSTVELYFDTPQQATAAADRAVELDAAACEFLNAECIRIVREHNPELGIPAAGSLLLIEFTGHGHAVQAASLARELGAGRRFAPRVSSDPGEQEELWKVRKRMLFTVKNPSPGREALSVVNDVGVPRAKLPELVRLAERIFARRGLLAPIYGHAGSGNLHMRPVFDLTRPDVVETVEGVAAEIYGEVTRLDGTITAEHGMGPLRAPYLELEWPPGLLAYMRELKSLFEPAGILNPGAMLPGGRPPAYRFVASDR